ncbi:MAG: TetR/AcrR family transcriptional regulator [Clostridia bacterium]|nr:TetR/AcrR family transcriptional regulator [Clostridia bacterium]
MNEQLSATKENILRVSLEVFAEKGYEASSVADIAAGVGFGKSALYKHYKSKREILDRIILRMEESEKTFKNEHSYIDKQGVPDFKALEEYVFALFCRWTEDEFCASFRKLLTLEQFSSQEMADLYRTYLTEGPVFELTDVFASFGGSKAVAMGMAMYLYSPLYLYYSMYDSADEKKIVVGAARAHIHRFMTQLQV